VRIFERLVLDPAATYHYETTPTGQPATPDRTGSTTTTTSLSASAAAAAGDYREVGRTAGGGRFTEDVSLRVAVLREQIAQGGAPDLSNVSDATVTSSRPLYNDDPRRQTQRGSNTAPGTHSRTIGGLLNELATWDPAEIQRMQQMLWEAGYYGRTFYGEDAEELSGINDADLRGAYALLLSDALLATGKPIEQILEERRRDFAATGRLARGGKVKPGEFSGGSLNRINLDSEASLDAMIEEIATSELGQNADPKFKSRLIAALRMRDAEQQQRVIDAEENQRRTNFDAAVAQNDADALNRGITPDTITPDQLAVAQTIVDVGKARGASTDAIVAAVATGMFESRLTNLSGGDADSEGVFQQRPSQGWTGLQDVAKAAGEFYDKYEKAEGATPGERAANVQRPAEQYRGGYTANLGDAAAIVTKVTGEDAGVASIAEGARAGADVFVPSSTTIVENFDPRAEAEKAVREQDPAGYQAHEFAGQYSSLRRFINRGRG
jgi:hypothetical protein